MEVIGATVIVFSFPYIVLIIVGVIVYSKITKEIELIVGEPMMVWKPLVVLTIYPLIGYAFLFNDRMYNSMAFGSVEGALSAAEKENSISEDQASRLSAVVEKWREKL